MFVISKIRYIEVLFHTFYCTYLWPGHKISFVISRTSLNRGSLNRGSTVAYKDIFYLVRWPQSGIKNWRVKSARGLRGRLVLAFPQKILQTLLKR